MSGGSAGSPSTWAEIRLGVSSAMRDKAAPDFYELAWGATILTERLRGEAIYLGGEINPQSRDPVLPNPPMPGQSEGALSHRMSVCALVVSSRSIEQVLGDRTCFYPSYDPKNKLILSSPLHAFRALVLARPGLKGGYQGIQSNASINWL